MSTITPQTVAAAGTNETLQAATSSDSIAEASGATYRVVTSGTPVTVTFTAVTECSQGVLHDVTWGPLPATGTSERPIPPQCVDPNTGDCAVGHSATTGVTVGAFK